MEITIAGRKFRSLRAATDFCRGIKLHYKNGQKIEGFDDIFLRDFLQTHPRGDLKVGCGISHFFVQCDKHWGNSRQFVLVRIDGTSTIFSHNQLKKKKETPEDRQRRKAKEAMREAIMLQVIDFRTKHLSEDSVCPITGKRLTLQNVHVDHQYPKTFEFLVARWMELSNLSFADITVSDNSDICTFDVMKGVKQKESWQRFHADNAVLRLLSREANLGPAKRGA